MNRILPRIFRTVAALVACAVLSVSAIANPAAGADVRVEDGWIRSLPGDLPAGGYGTIVNDTAAEVVLVDVSSPDYGRVQIHQSYTTPEGNARMRQIKRLRIPAHGRVAFAPGGYHLMMMDARKPMQPGDRVQVELRFAGGSVVQATLLVRPASYGG
ncbi:MAG TPA: copper chaperone PCu(A)C [Opitutaceae bacterium]|nr:copper chaperone PCu(A)C [Opitutaceae bacterium]